MPLNPNRIYTQNGIIINEFLLSQNKAKCELPTMRLAAAPSGICIYQMPNLPIRSNTSIAEYYTRRTYYGDMRDFVPHYYIDKFAAWKILESARQGWHGKNFVDNTNRLGVVICGDNKRAQTNCIKLVCGLLKEFSLGLNSIHYKFTPSPEFLDDMRRRTINSSIPDFKEVLEQTQTVVKKIAVAAPVIPTISFEVLIDKSWKKPIKGKPIRAVKINIDQGKLQYRTHLINGGWLDWSSNGEVSGHTDTYIDGIQFEYVNDNYKLEYSFSTIDGMKANWRSTNFILPTKKQIDLLDLRIKSV